MSHVKKRKVVEKSGRPSHFSRVKVRGLVCINGIYSFQGKQALGVRPPRVSLGTRDFDEAVKLAMEMSQNMDSRYVPGSWDFEIRRYIDDRKLRRKSQWTTDSDESALKQFVAFLGPTSRPVTVTTKRVEDWRDKLRADGKAEPTVKTYVNRLHGFFAFLRLPRNPVDEVELPIIKTTKADRFCSHEERDLLFKLCPRSDLEAMLMLGFHAGMRLNEMVQMRIDWIVLWPEGGEIKVQSTPTFVPKGKKARRIPMNSVLLAYCRNLKKAGKLTGTYFIRDDVEPGKSKYRWEPRKIFDRLRTAANLDWVGWHTLRHTFATQLVIGGCPIASVAKWLGDDIQTTYNTYVGYSPVEAHVNAGLSKAVEPPKKKAKPKKKAA